VSNDMLGIPHNTSTAATRASGSSFYFAMRILPHAQRAAMFEIYAFCRAVDDIADSDAPHSWRLDGLARWRHTIEALYCGAVPDELQGLSQAVHEFALRQHDFHAVIDGMEMDAARDIQAPDWPTLDLYCDRVAGAVGRLSVRVFGLAEDDGLRLAHHLGRALQLTNILRDLDEDAGVGRLYLPREALHAAGITATDPVTAVTAPTVDAACRFVVERARDHFARAGDVMDRCPRRLIRAPRIMQLAYRQMLEDMVTRGWDCPRSRVHVSRSHLLGIALRHAFL